MFQSLRHLLPDSTAWTVVVDKLLRRYLEGVSSVGTDARQFIDEVAEDVLPDSTRELAEWQDQFALWKTGDELSQRAGLDAAWKANGGQSPRYLQDVMQAAGFPVYVHEWWEGGGGLSSAAIDQVFPSVPTNSQNIAFNADGTKAFFTLLGTSVYQYALATPYTIDSGMTYETFLPTSGLDTNVTDIAISTDGTKFFALGGQTKRILEYTLSTPNDISSATFTDAKDISAEFSAPQYPSAFTFSADGTKVVVLQNTFGEIHQYTMGAWDLTGFALDASPASLPVGQAAGVAFWENGNRLLVQSRTFRRVYEYSCPSAYDITGLVPHSDGFSTAGADSIAAGLFADQTNERVYLLGLTDYDLFRYSMSQGIIDPRDHTNQPTIGTYQCGDVDVVCSPDPGTSHCNRFLANEVWYLVNKTYSPDAPDPVPDEQETWPYFVYWGGETFPDRVTIPEDERERFEALLLKYNPTHMWIVTLIDIGAPVDRGSFTVNPGADIGQSWSISPGGYSGTGADGPVTRSLVPADDYTITWSTVPGYEVPVPETELLTLPADGDITFTTPVYTPIVPTGLIIEFT